MTRPGLARLIFLASRERGRGSGTKLAELFSVDGGYRMPIGPHRLAEAGSGPRRLVSIILHPVGEEMYDLALERRVDAGLDELPYVVIAAALRHREGCSRGGLGFSLCTLRSRCFIFSWVFSGNRNCLFALNLILTAS